jgi:hypothetical protein
MSTVAKCGSYSFPSTVYAFSRPSPAVSRRSTQSHRTRPVLKASWTVKNVYTHHGSISHLSLARVRVLHQRSNVPVITHIQRKTSKVHIKVSKRGMAEKREAAGVVEVKWPGKCTVIVNPKTRMSRWHMS